MKTIKFLSVALLSMLLSDIVAQSYTDELLKYSLNDINGTARSIGAGGAFSTVGADMSAATSNPAGLGLYRASEISMSLGGVVNNNTATFLGTSAKSDQLKFNLPHIGGVFAIPLRNKATKFIQIGLVYNHLADYNRVQEFEGVNNSNSKVDVFYNNAITTKQPFYYDYYEPGTVQAWQTFLIDSTYNPTGALIQRAHGPVTQSGSYREKGGSNEFNISVSGNTNDKFFWGAGIGIPWLNYERTKVYNEAAVQYDSTLGFRSFSQSEYYRVNGVGMNFKLGFIVKPFPFWRFGASVTTPSAFFKLEENSSAYMTSVVDVPGYSSYHESDTFSSAPYKFKYTRPLKATFGTSFYLKQWGFLSVDYELNDYKHMSLNFAEDAPYTSEVNRDFSRLYGIGHTVKAGAEFAWKVLRIRAGYQWNSTPFQTNVGVKNYDLQRQTFTGGLGYRGKVFFADLAYAHTMGADYTSLYRAVTNEPALYNKFTNDRIVLTLGVRFGGKRN